MHGFTMSVSPDVVTEKIVCQVVVVCNCHILWGGVIFATACCHLLDLFRRLAMHEECVMEPEEEMRQPEVLR